MGVIDRTALGLPARTPMDDVLAGDEVVVGLLADLDQVVSGPVVGADDESITIRSHGDARYRARREDLRLVAHLVRTHDGRYIQSLEPATRLRRAS